MGAGTIHMGSLGSVSAAGYRNPSSWTPADTTSATALHWFRPDQGVTLVGSKVSLLNDLIGSLNQSQGTDAQRFTFSASDAAYGNQPVLVGTASQMTGAAVTAIVAPVSLLVVGQLDANLTTLISAGASPYNLLWRNGGVAATAIAQFYGLAGGLNSAGNGAISSAGAFLITDDGTASGAACQIYTNDLSIPSSSGAKKWGSVTTMGIGLPAAGVGACTGKFAESVVWAGVLSAADRAHLSVYLGRYGF